MSGRVLALNGTSSSGKTTLGRALQERLPGIWLLVGTDTFLTSAPGKLYEDPDGITFRQDGSITVGDRFHVLYEAWRAAVSALVRAGADVILDEVLLGGADEQVAWDRAFEGVDVRWIGVHCDVEVAAAREAARGDRQPGQVRDQAGRVHAGVRYDIEIDTTSMPPETLADSLCAFAARSGGVRAQRSVGDLPEDEAVGWGDAGGG